MERRKAAEKTVDNLYAWVDELHVELNAEKEAQKTAKKEVKSQQTQLSNARSIASKQLVLLNSLKLELRKARDDLADESHQRDAMERMNTIQLEIKRERKVGRRDGAKKWPVHIAIQPLKPNLWNKVKVEAWCKDYGDIDYGIIDK